jgi:hypothetical protein
MMADFAFSSADTKLGRFDNSFFSAVPFPGGLYFAFRSFCETLYLITARSGESAFLDRAVTSGLASILGDFKDQIRRMRRCVRLLSVSTAGQAESLLLEP